jgi:hypothetical protein
VYLACLASTHDRHNHRGCDELFTAYIGVMTFAGPFCALQCQIQTLWHAQLAYRKTTRMAQRNLAPDCTHFQPSSSSATKSGAHFSLEHLANGNFPTAISRATGANGSR